MTPPVFNPHELTPDPNPRRFVVGISGASGAWYSIRLLELLLGMGHEVHLVVSDYGRRLLFDEADVRTLDFENLLPHVATRLGPAGPRAGERRAMESRLVIHPNKDVGAVIASGSFIHDGMVVLPCSSASLGQLATGSGSNLLCRAAMVTLKERRTLIVCHREMPLSLIDIRNMEQLSLAGAVLCSPNPGFYLGPRGIGDIVDFVVGKVLDLLKVPHALKTRWEDHVSGELEVEG
ncbi:MAG: UbiX family flavin prenyltransferase [Phycisphaerales bacterium]|jgi:4-hydroxy-3-polyprenylbenzoate decarboxylase|nr:UbiX family flavin prenyltransferase [Phycisphaerales bacterium]